MADRKNDTPAAAGVEVGQSTPILRVADIEASVAYYVDALGFTEQWRWGVFAQVRRGHAALMLSQGDQGQPCTWVYIGVSDVDALRAEIEPRGAKVRHPATNYPWGAREMQVSDPDGHVLRFGSDATPGEPVGEWLDGECVRWRLQDDGSWQIAD